MSTTLQFIDNLVTVHVAPEDTDGAFGLAEVLARPGDQPPLHVHRAEDEGFHVVEGEVTLWIGDRPPLVVPAGHAAIAPRGIPHTYRVTSEANARFFVTATPASFVRFVLAFGTPTDAADLWDEPAGPPDAERLGRMAAAEGIDIIGPPGMLPSDLAAAVA